MQLLEDKIHDLRLSNDDLVSDASGELKSSAGDKHETARAMMQLEQEKIAGQIDGFEKQKYDLARIGISVKQEKAGAGTLVRTDDSLVYLAVSLGRQLVDGIPVMIISIHSPLGQQLLGKAAGDSAEINGKKYRVVEII